MQEEKKYQMLPANDAVQNWFEENIDKECSASSAVYKFRLWLESLQHTQHPGSAVWVKATTRLPASWHLKCVRFIHTKQPLIDPETWLNENPKAIDVVEWLDESKSPSKEGNKEAVNVDELWDEHSELIGDGIDDLTYWAGRIIMKKEDFVKAIEQYNQQKEGMK